MPPKSKRVKICPSCGTALADRDTMCPQCGKKFNRGGKKSGNGDGKSGKTKKVTCPACGELVSNRSKKCPICEAVLSPDSDKEKLEPSAKKTGEIEEDIVERESPIAASPCPMCGWHLSGEESSCPQCGIPIVPERQTTQTDAPTTIVTADEAPEVVKVIEDEDSRPCPVCDSRIPKNLEKCPVCNANLVEPVPEEKIQEGSEPAPEAQPSGESVSPVPADLKKPAPRVRQRKIRTTGVTTIPAPAPANELGRTNDLGKVNGLARTSSRGVVNGTGVVNGNSFVNGSGITNGAGGRHEAKETRRASRILRWQFLAVLIVVILIVPVFVFLSYSNQHREFAIDGNFSDWDGATTYGIMIQSTSPTTNISEWAVEVQSQDLLFYFSTEASMMSSNDAESYYLFVDSDGSNTTGYVLESIGADYLLRLTGWDSAVNSTSISEYRSSTDQFDWSAWTSTGALSYSLDGRRLEASARMPEVVGPSAKFVLVSKDPMDRGSVSYTVPSKGGVLIVQQAPSADASAYGTIIKNVSSEMLTLKFTCDGEGGKVTQVNPVIVGASQANHVTGFDLETGEEHVISIAVDTSSSPIARLISAEVVASGIDSTFASVQIIGSGASAYVEAPPSEVVIDGAFADWEGRLSSDVDSIPVTNPDLDIHEVGSVGTSLTSSFYVSVQGEMCVGTFIPAQVTKPSGGGGGAVVIPARKTAEDTMNIYVDSDLSNSTGAVMTLNSKVIGADRKIEVKGLFGKITSTKEFTYQSSSDTWLVISADIEAAKDEQRIEIGVNAGSLGASGDVDFIVETTSWEGRMDLATFDPSTVMAMTKTWVVDPSTSSASATSLSCQRKLFFDGANFWSFYFDGTNTVYRYSNDSGVTWSTSLTVFATAGVNKVSVWFDPRIAVVYAVGDIGTPTRNVTIQRGAVDSAAQTITWGSSDSLLTVSSQDQGDKNAFISKDASGYLWILASNSTGIIPIRQDLSSFKSSTIDDMSSWIYEGNILGAGNNQANVKGSILPAGKGSDMWAIYAYAGNVASRRYSTGWSPENIIYASTTGIIVNTDNSPPSAVVDSKGVVHVVYGTGRKSGPASAPTIEYSFNNTDQTTFTKGLDLDPTLPGKAGDFYPSISLDTSTDNLYALWLRSDSLLVPMAIAGKMNSKGAWMDLTIDEQTIFPKQYLTSIYSAPDGSKICWQWTQNTTAPTQIFFDGLLIPELSGLAPLVGASIAVIALTRIVSRRKSELG